ncbi:MAG: hypothetical protein WDO24_10760 [Pseudomonadota bacterium]
MTIPARLTKNASVRTQGHAQDMHHRLNQPGPEEDGGAERGRGVGRAADLRDQHERGERRQILDQVEMRAMRALRPLGQGRWILRIADRIDQPPHHDPAQHVRQEQRQAQDRAPHQHLQIDRHSPLRVFFGSSARHHSAPCEILRSHGETC